MNSITYMLEQLSGPDTDTATAITNVLGKKLIGVAVDEEKNHLLLSFDNGASIRVWDDGQSCCESRYMSTDDDLAPFVGATLTNLELRDGPRVDNDYETHDQQFLVVTTSLGSFTVVNHNEHNGYYGGFVLRAEAA